ncbi:MAG: MarR family transcriptional regulator [Aeromicrobium sp.]|uniref:MarR family winged helix-turn-helix transcriptional regulator n=1 Tax=Aeromicrobium sp. TaxID=1871063 RepID=UPI0025BA570E|nr:MarR family transcriptional regulator [Aeromicrobium sp.]MCK5891390.1 MarR family transcriptional regulator [Aeromicrobium sp.]MDF1704464.1 MarR family transcriptional regulator [Aeromicrobium sp.]
MSTSSVVLYDQLQEFLQRVMGVMQSRTGDAAADLDLTINQAKTVFLLARSPEPLAISTIAEEVGISVAAQGRVIDRLVKLAVVERRESEADRRVKLVSLAPRGLQIADAHGAQKAQALRDVVDQIPPDLCARLSAALEPILAGHHLCPTSRKK